MSAFRKDVRVVYCSSACPAWLGRDKYAVCGSSGSHGTSTASWPFICHTRNRIGSLNEVDASFYCNPSLPVCIEPKVEITKHISDLRYVRRDLLNPVSSVKESGENFKIIISDLWTVKKVVQYAFHSTF